MLSQPDARSSCEVTPYPPGAEQAKTGKEAERVKIWVRDLQSAGADEDLVNLRQRYLESSGSACLHFCRDSDKSAQWEPVSPHPFPLS